MELEGGLQVGGDWVVRMQPSRWHGNPEADRATATARAWAASAGEHEERLKQGEGPILSEVIIEKEGGEKAGRGGRWSKPGLSVDQVTGGVTEVCECVCLY